MENYGYIQMALFLETPKWKSQNCPKKLVVYIFLKSNLFGAWGKLFYNSQKDLSNGVWHTSIRAHLTLVLKGFVVGSTISNLTPSLSFDHNSCVSSPSLTLTFCHDNIKLVL
jgi:hypothetical protein